MNGLEEEKREGNVGVACIGMEEGLRVADDLSIEFQCLTISETLKYNEVVLPIGGGNCIKLTVNERIMLHLRSYYAAKKELEAPQAVTQKGIADAIGIRVTHVPRSVKKLEEEGLIYEGVMHIKGLDKRRKAYFLTEKGMYHANDIKRNLEDRNVAFRDSNGKVKEVKFSDIEDMTGIKLGLLDLVKLKDREGILDQRSIEMVAKSPQLEALGKETRPFDFPHKVPVTKKFVGRGEEMESLSKWVMDEEVRLVSVQGDAGIGKSSLVAEVLSELKDEVSIFWFGFGRGEGFEDMIDYLSEFCSKLNRGELITALRAKEKGLGEVLKATTLALSGTSARLVFDALDEADDRSKKFLSLLFQNLDMLSDVKIIILHRAGVKQYAKETMDSAGFRELKLKGLDKKSCKALLRLKKLEKDEFERIFRLTEGNPQALKLIKSEDIGELRKSGKYTPDELTLIKYLKSLDKL